MFILVLVLDEEEEEEEEGSELELEEEENSFGVQPTTVKSMYFACFDTWFI